MAPTTRSLSRICAACRTSVVVEPIPARSIARTTVFRSHEPTPRRCIAPFQSRWISGTSRRPTPSQPEPALPSEAAHSNTSAASSPPSRPPQTHYDLFPETLPLGPPPTGHFPIDVRALRREFLRLQARAHPDLHPAERKTAAQATSALINEAFRTLANPLLRAQYLLSLKGINAADDERAKVEDPALLVEVMEAREAIEEAREEGVLHEVREANDDRIRRSEDVLEEAFRVDDLPTAVEETVRLRYWVGIKDSLDHWEPGGGTEIGIGH